LLMDIPLYHKVKNKHKIKLKIGVRNFFFKTVKRNLIQRSLV
jgi:hypothetical protein